jgi:cytochrome c556
MRPNASSVFSRATADQRLFSLLVVAIASLVLFATPTFADEEMDQAQIKYRQTLMGGVGANMGGIGTILKNQLNLPGHVESHARQIAESSKLVAAAFKANLSAGATDAKPEIWADWADFEKAIADLDAAANALADAAASGDGAAIGPAVKGLGKSCGGCHDSFRKPKEESYKNQ